MPDRLTRDQYGLRLAEAAALRADCTRRQVGAVIIAEDGSVIATGYNGLAAGKPGCLSAGACPRGQLSYDEHPADVAYEETGCRAVHAEVNAIIRAGRDRCIGATIYVTDTPCFHCSVVIEGAGLARTVTPSDLALDRLRDRLAEIFPVEETKTEAVISDLGIQVFHGDGEVIRIGEAVEPDPEAVRAGWIAAKAHRDSLLSEADRLWLRP